jgi:hypothetical protein
LKCLPFVDEFVFAWSTLKRSAPVFTCRQIDRYWGFHTNCVPENINAGGNLTGSRKLDRLTCYLTQSFSKVGQGDKWHRPNPDFSCREIIVT